MAQKISNGNDNILNVYEVKLKVFFKLLNRFSVKYKFKGMQGNFGKSIKILMHISRTLHVVEIDERIQFSSISVLCSVTFKLIH